MYAYHYVGSRMQQGAIQKPFQHALAASSFHRAFIHFCSANDHITFPKTGGERKMTLAQTPKNCDSEDASRKKLHTLL